MEVRIATDKCLQDLKSNCLWWGLRRKGSMLGPGYNAGLLGASGHRIGLRGNRSGTYMRRVNGEAQGGFPLGCADFEMLEGRVTVEIFSKCCKMRLQF